MPNSCTTQDGEALALTQIEGVGETHYPVPYSDTLAQTIARHYANGMSLSRIARMSEMPGVSTLYRWIQDNREFRKILEGVRDLRAMAFEDQALDTAGDVEDPREVPAARLKCDTYWKAAEVNDPNRYGKKTTVSGDPTRPLQFIISTGFPAPNAAQTPPEIGADGLIIQPAKNVQEISHGEGHPEDPAEDPGVGCSDDLCGGDSGEAPGETPRTEADGS